MVTREDNSLTSDVKTSFLLGTQCIRYLESRPTILNYLIHVHPYSWAGVENQVEGLLLASDIRSGKHLNVKVVSQIFLKGWLCA